MPRESLFLILASVGLVPIALGYGASPQTMMPMLYGIEVEGVNLTHIFRAVMGLYLAMVLLWLAGAFRASLRDAALVSLVVFMLGLAAGRLFSLAVDGLPHWLLLTYMLLELGFGAVGAWFLIARREA